MGGGCNSEKITFSVTYITGKQALGEGLITAKPTARVFAKIASPTANGAG